MTPRDEMCALCGCEFTRIRHALGTTVRLCEPCAEEVDEILSADAEGAEWRDATPVRRKVKVKMN